MKWIETQELLASHDWLLNQQPGVHGIADKGRAEAIIHRIHNLVHYEGVTDLFEIAGQYLSAISRGHIFADGNKRTAFCVAMLFLWRNGKNIQDDGTELVNLTVSAAMGKSTRKEIAEVLRKLSEDRDCFSGNAK